MARSLPRSAPADEQVDPAAILGFLDAVEGHPDVEMHSLMVVRHGKVIAEGWWEPYTAGRPQLLYSLSKVFTSTAAAFAQADGLLNLEDPVISLSPGPGAASPAPARRGVGPRPTPWWAGGQARERRGGRPPRAPAEPVRGFLLIPPDQEP